TQKPELLSAMSGALAGALHNVFLTGVAFAFLAVLSGFWLPSGKVEAESDASKGSEKLPRTSAECERLLIAEMTTMSPEQEPDAVKARDSEELSASSFLEAILSTAGMPRWLFQI